MFRVGQDIDENTLGALRNNQSIGQEGQDWNIIRHEAITLHIKVL